MLLSPNTRWLRIVGTVVLAWPLHAPQAQASCAEPPFVNTLSSAGRPLLGQGIALYEARNLAQAGRSLQAALVSGLPDPMERATAHKYLAFIACTQNQWTRCETAFESAFTADAGFALQAYETAATPWGQAYERVRRRWSQRCPQAQARSQAAHPHADSAGQGFALQSRVITAVMPLAQAGAPPAGRAPASAAAAAGHNLRLRVSPWAQVRINGKPYGVTPPLVLLKLAPGTHTVELRSPGFESYRQVMELTAGQLQTISYDFDAR